MAGPLIFANPAHAGIQEDLRTRLERAAAAYGAPLTITSGLAGRPTTPGSMHPHGRASDLSMAGMDEAARLRLAQTLREQGVRRFGTYTNNPDMLHVDMSDAQGGNHYMHDKTRRNLDRAPGWFRDFAGGAGPDVRQAAATAGMSTDTERTMPGDPMTGRAYSSPQETTMLPSLPPMAPLAQEAPQEAGNPLLQTLMRVALGTAVAGGGNIGAGAILAGGAMRDSELAENALYDLQNKRRDRQRRDALSRWGESVAQTPGLEDVGAMMQVDPAIGMRLYAERQAAQQAQGQRQVLADTLRQQGNYREAALVEAGANLGSVSMSGPTAPTYGTTPHYEREGDQTYVTRYASDGTKIREPVQGTPWAVERGSPEFTGTVAAAGAAGKQEGETRATREKNQDIFNSVAAGIEQILPDMPNGIIDRAFDVAGSAFGYDTKNARAMAAMRPLAGAMVNTIEKQPGPASDLDVRMLKEAAGNLVDPLLTIGERNAAWETVKMIAAKLRDLGHPYFAKWGEVREGTPATPPKPATASGGWKIERE